jgi:hypothetical protein
MHMIWHLICVTCFGWDYGCDAACMIILWCDISLDKKIGGLGTKASVNWGDQWINGSLGTKASVNWGDQWINESLGTNASIHW